MPNPWPRVFIDDHICLKQVTNHGPHLTGRETKDRNRCRGGWGCKLSGEALIKPWFRALPLLPGNHRFDYWELLLLTYRVVGTRFPPEDPMLRFFHIYWIVIWGFPSGEVEEFVCILWASRGSRAWAGCCHSSDGWRACPPPFERRAKTRRASHAHTVPRPRLWSSSQRTGETRSHLQFSRKGRGFSGTWDGKI